MIPTSKTPVKTQENCKKNVRKIQKASPTRENVSILHYAMGKNASQLRFGRALVAFWLGFGWVLVGFWLCFAHKAYQNANPMHSVIWL